MPELLLIGTLPPPVGGVTIYVSRLREALSPVKDFHVAYADYKKEKLSAVFLKLSRTNAAHINISNPYLILALVLFAALLRKKTILTIHENVAIRKGFPRKLYLTALRLCTVPVMLNEGSLQLAKKYNKKAVQISSFIPPQQEEPLPPEIIQQLLPVRSQYEQVYCTNAFNVAFDANGHETYGITDLITVFSTLPRYALIFSDPTGNYVDFLQKNGIVIPSNVICLHGLHSFYEVIKQSDVVIRATSTDGDSVSVKEALYLNTKVIASDCVSRPQGVFLYRTFDKESLRETIKQAVTAIPEKYHLENTVEQIVKAYRSVLFRSPR